MRQDRTGPSQSHDHDVGCRQLACHYWPLVTGSICFPNPFWSATNANRRQGIAFVMPLDPVPVVVARAGVSDHPPADHVAVTTVYGVSEKSFLRVLQQ